MSESTDVTLPSGDTTSDPQPQTRSAELRRGDAIGRYVVLEAIGRGSMGVVYAAYDPKLDRRIAIKVVHGHSSVLREAQSLAKLSHRNVVAVHDVGETSGQVFIAMEFVEGLTLDRWLGAQERTWDEILGVLVDAGLGLAAAHDAGLVHRDFKPANVIVGDDGRVCVMDFGLARALGPPAEDRSVGGRAQIDLTSIAGTPAYMSPEQHAGDPLDARTDQFSFCVTAYNALFDGRPFAGESAVELATSVSLDDPREPNSASVAAWIWPALKRGLRRDPGDRWPTMDLLLEALARDPTQQRRRRTRMVVGAAVVVAAVGVGVAVAVVRDHERCVRASAAMDTVWGPAARALLVERLDAAQIDPQRHGQITQTLDDYAGAWRASSESVCRTASTAGPGLGDQVLRGVCLDARLTEMAEWIRVLGEAESQRLPVLSARLAGITAVAACDDVEALRRKMPQPDPPQVAQEAAEIRRLLARHSVLDHAGRYADALAVVNEAVALAKRIDHRPLLASALVGRADTRLRGLEVGSAPADLRLAFNLAIGEGHDELALGAARLLAYAASLESTPGEIRTWAEVAIAFSERLDDDRQRVRLYTMLGMALNQVDHERSLSMLQRSVDLGREALGITSEAFGHAALNLGIAKRVDGKNDAAEAVLREAIAAFEVALGADSGFVERGRLELSRCLLEQGRLDDAETTARANLAAIERSTGAQSGHYGRQLLVLADVAGTRGDLVRAVELGNKALRTFEKTLGPRSLLLANANNKLGWAHGAAGRYDEAALAYERAVSILSTGSVARVLSNALFQAGRMRFLGGHYDEALEHYERLIDLYAKEFPLDYTRRGSTLVARGRTQLRLGLDDAGRRSIELGLLMRLSRPERSQWDAVALAARAMEGWPPGASKRAQRELARAASEMFEDVEVSLTHKEREQLAHWLETHDGPAK